MKSFANWNTLPDEQLTAVTRKIYHGNDIMLVRNVIDPRVVVAMHDHPHEQMLFVLSGACDVVTSEETQHLEAGGLAWFPSNMPHSVINTQDEPLIALDVFTPIREDFLKK